MSFVATIEDAENKVFFCKVINSLNQFSNSEEIKFTITNKNLKLSVFNRLRTSYGEVIIDKDFFGSFEFQSDGFYDEGLNVENEEDDETNISYSFLVRSRILGMLFKYDAGVDSYKLSVSIEDGYENQLKVEIRNMNLIRKEYNPFYIPFKDEKLNISKEYKLALSKLLKNQYRDEENQEEIEEINYLVISNSIVKSFLDNIGSNTEDFKIEVNLKKFSMTGYTKKVNNKEENLLKQSMAINISFRTDELIDFKLFNEGNNDKKIIFRLKDFKNFLNLGQNNEIIEIWFKSAGDPILFEMNKFNCKIQFIQITDSDENEHNNATKIKKLFKNDVNLESLRKPNRKVIEEPESLFVPVDDDNDPPVEEFEKDSSPEIDDRPIIGWNNDIDQDANTTTSKQQFLQEMKQEYLQQMNKRQRINEGEEELGPTQNVTKARGIFD